MPFGPGATCVGAVVISIYVVDLAWLMEGNLRKMPGVHRARGAVGCTSAVCTSAGVCQCGGNSDFPEDICDERRRQEAPAA